MVVGRFFAVGFICALLHNAIVMGGDWLGVHYVLSTLFSFAIVASFGYWLHCTWTFPGSERNGTTLARYAFSMSGNLPLFLAGMFVAVDVASCPVAIAVPLVTVFLWVFNFAATRWALRA
jgi:putative flippase GtrA